MNHKVDPDRRHRRVQGLLGWLAAAMAAVLLAGCAAAPPSRPKSLAIGDQAFTRSYGRWLAQREMARAGVVGLALALVDGEEVVWAEGFGFADKEKRIPATADTVFLAGSISKLFTATALMQLVERGQADLDRPLQTYLPEFGIRSRFTTARPITLRLLLTHHSGLPADRWAGFAEVGAPPADPEAGFLALPGLLRDDYLAAPPGQSFSYSNLGYSLVGAAVNRITGDGFRAHMQRTLFTPMGMRATSFDRDDAVREGLSRGYVGGKAVAPISLRDMPAGGLSSTARDLAQFVKMVLADGRSGASRIVGPGTLREMLRVQNDDVPLDGGLRVGLGYSISDEGAFRIVGHAGGLPSFYSQLLIAPDQNLGVVVLTNSEGGALVSQRVARKVLQLAWESKTGHTIPASPREPPEVELPREKLDSLAGTYAVAAEVARVERSRGHLEASLRGTTIHLLPLQGGTFCCQYRLLGLIPISNEALAGCNVSIRQLDGREIVFAGPLSMPIGERIAGAPLSGPWRDRVGRYEIVNPGTYPMFLDPELVYDEDTSILAMKARVPIWSSAEVRIPLRPLGGSEAVTLGVGEAAGITIRAVGKGADERLAFSGYELRRVP